MKHTEGIGAAVPGAPTHSSMRIPEKGVPSGDLDITRPHIGRDGVGAKWEEMLVVTDNDAYWLDDAVSHLRV